jgi:hypothetical protein
VQLVPLRCDATFQPRNGHDDVGNDTIRPHITALLHRVQNLQSSAVTGPDTLVWSHLQVTVAGHLVELLTWGIDPWQGLCLRKIIEYSQA